MSGEPDFEVVLEQLRRRDEVAATQVFQRFARQLIALAANHLDSRVRQKVDAEDVVQSVFRTAFSRLGKGQFELENWDSLWGLLTRITVRKCGKWADYYHTGARNLNREVSPPQGESESNNAWEFINRDPSPSEAAILAETLERVIHGLDFREQQIATLILEGEPVPEITTRIGCTQSKVYRVMKMIRNRLERWHGENGN